MVKKVFLRRVDENLYREAKARASLLGVSVSEVINMALREWLAKRWRSRRGRNPPL